MRLAPIGAARKVTWMIDSVVNLLFRCGHKRLTRPVTPVSKDGKPHGDTYVVCLDCGKQFSYDPVVMRIGKALPTSAATGVLPPGMPGPRRSGFKVAMIASVLPIGVALGSVLTSRRQRKKASSPATSNDKPEKESLEPAKSADH